MSLSNEEIITKASELWASDNSNSASEAVKLLQQLFDKGQSLSSW